MRAYRIFAAMTEERAAALLRTLKKEAPGAFAQAVQATCAALKSRPSYLLKQPFEKQVAAVRRALSRVVANPMAQETLAIYFLECRKSLLVEWLDAVGVEHEEGLLKQDAPAPPPDDRLHECVEGFRSRDDDPDRDLLLKAFAAQEALEWPTLDALLEEIPG